MPIGEIGVVAYLPTPDEFKGRVAVVTGGTSGLGRHLCAALAELGVEVFFCGTSRERGEAAQRAMGSHAHFICCDLRVPEQAAAFVNDLATHDAVARRGIDYLVNNAAIDPRIQFESATVDDFDLMIHTNLRPYFIVTRAALPWLQKGEGKAIVNISTTNWMLGLTPFTLYNASKSAILGFTRSLARELGPIGIRANTLSPGWIMTERQLREHVTEEDKRQLLRDQALPFLLTEDHVTPVTLFLLSSASSGITGQNVVVDGGKVMQ